MQAAFCYRSSLLSYYSLSRFLRFFVTNAIEIGVLSKKDPSKELVQNKN